MAETSGGDSSPGIDRHAVDAACIENDNKITVYTFLSTYLVNQTSQIVFVLCCLFNEFLSFSLLSPAVRLCPI